MSLKERILAKIKSIEDDGIVKIDRNAEVAHNYLWELVEELDALKKEVAALKQSREI